MRKRLKSIAAFITAICLCMAFIACDTGLDTGGGGNGGGSAGGGGGGSGGDGGSDLPKSEVYVLYEDGEFVKGLALELFPDGTCAFWDGGEHDDGVYETVGNVITVTLHYPDDEDEVFDGTVSGDSITLTVYDDVWLMKKYSGNDWKGEGGSGSSGDVGYVGVKAFAISEVCYSAYDEAVNAFLQNELDAENILETECVSYNMRECKLGFVGLSEKIDSGNSIIYEISADVKSSVSIENIEFETRAQQTFYIAESAEKGIRYVVGEPTFSGERLTKSYGQYLTDFSRFDSFTVKVKTSEKTENSDFEFVSGKIAKIIGDAAYEAEIYDENRFSAQTPAYDASATTQDTEYYYYPDANDVQNSYRRVHKYEKSTWDPQPESGDFYENKEQGLKEYADSLFRLAYGLYVKTDFGFVIPLEDGEGHTAEYYRTEVSNDRITRIEETLYGNREKRITTTFSDFDTTETKAPAEADITQIVSIAIVSNVYSSVFENKLKAVAESTGAKAVLKRMTYSELPAYIATLSQNRNGADVIMTDKSAAYTAIKNGVFADLTELLSDVEYAEKTENLHNGIKNDFVYDAQSGTWGIGATYAVPVSFTACGMGYNKTLLSANRQLIDSALEGDTEIPRNDDNSVKMPWEMDFAAENYTWEQYAAMAAALSSSKVYGCDMPDIELLTHSFGGSFLSADRNTVFENLQPFKDAAAFQASLIDSGATSRSAHDMRESYFVNGKLCFMSACEYEKTSMYNQALESGNWGIMPYPSNGAAASWKGISYGSYGFAVNANSDRKAKALELIMALLDDDVQTELINSGYTLPVLKSLNGVFAGNDSVDSVAYKTKQTLLGIVSGTNSFVSDRVCCASGNWLGEIERYTNNILNASRGAAASCLYSDTAYANFKTRVQGIYDAGK